MTVHEIKSATSFNRTAKWDVFVRLTVPSDKKILRQEENLNNFHQRINIQCLAISEHFLMNVSSQKLQATKTQQSFPISISKLLTIAYLSAEKKIKLPLDDSL
jgi:hypothetical protein